MSKLRILTEDNPSIFNQFVAEIRDVNIQKDRMRFRRNLERAGELFAYEISKELTYQEKDVITPFGVAKEKVLEENPLLVTILRAGLPFHQGLLNYFDRSDNGYISAYRKHHKGGAFDIELEYISVPSIENKTVILSDPMLATGATMVMAYRALLEKGAPKHCHIVTIVASVEGIEYVQKNLPKNTTIWMAALDEEMTAQSYIVPGLGDV